MKEVVHAACPHDCPDACGVLITVEDGRATRIQGDPDHPITRGFLCAKVAKYLDRVYSPDRVLYPLRRIAPKGKGHKDFRDFERITWDQALDEIVTRFRDIIREHGSEAILPYSYGGTLAALSNASMDRRFFHRLGASQLNRTICSTTGGEALVSVIGKKLGTEPEQFRHSRYIIAWGANIHGNNVHLWPFIEEARRNGAKLVVIDPYRTRTARCADWYLPINPGTDAALALGMMHVIINERLYDEPYVAQHTLGFEALCAKVQEYPPDRVARWTGICEDDIIQLAREYATTRPAVIRLNYGIQRCETGGMAVRAVTMLPCITGSWKEVGGGLQLSTSGGWNLNRSALERTDLMPRATRVVNMVEIGRALNELRDPPIKAMFVYNCNPAAVAPDHNAVVRGMKRPDLFTVAHEQFLTDSTDYADIVLPATTFFEQKDLQTGYGHYYLAVSQPAIAPVGECRSNVEVFRELALGMGFDEPCFRESVDQMIDAALSSGHPYLEGITRERMEREGHLRLNFPIPISDFRFAEQPDANKAADQSEVRNQKSEMQFFLPFADGFPTPSGKAELYSEQLKVQGLDPVASFTPPVESRHTEQARRYPLELLARKADNFLNSSFCNLPQVQRLEHRGVLEMNATDAAARGIRDGDGVHVFNDRGEINLVARVDGTVRSGVVAARLDWAKLSAGEININVLTSQRLSDLGAGPTFYSTLVQVRRA
jgi:anaerobic selenocysteine-containing dehydrogenase